MIETCVLTPNQQKLQPAGGASLHGGEVDIEYFTDILAFLHNRLPTTQQGRIVLFDRDNSQVYSLKFFIEIIS